MFGTEPSEAFQEFGPSAFFPQRRRLAFWDLPRDRKGRRKLIHTSAPRLPGVYGMIDANGELIYVGKSKRLANRLLCYFPATRGGEKAERIGSRAKRLVWETSAHEFLSLLRELELIRRFTPRFNVQGIPEHRRPAFIYLTSGPAPFFRVESEPPAGCEHYFGPLRGVTRFRAAVEHLNRRFLLRDCPLKTPMSFADQREMFAGDRRAGCLRYELGTCLGPCAALCTSRAYGRSVERALAFLRCDEAAVLTELEAAMHLAAKSQRFERAATLRDTWRMLALIRRAVGRLNELRRNFSFVYELHCRRGQKTWIFVREGHAFGAQPKPQTPRAAAAALRRLNEVYFDPTPFPHEDLDMLRLVGRWFHEREPEIKCTRTAEEAGAYCRSLLEQPVPRRKRVAHSA